MKSKIPIAAIAALGTLILAASPVVHAGSHDEWLMQQLQITDGFAPPTVARAKDETRTMTSAYHGVGAAQN